MTTRVITSLTNPAVKAARALHQRKERDETGLFLVEGLKSVTEGLRLGRAPRLLLHGEAASSHPLLREAAAAAAETALVSEAVLEKISRRDNPQAVVAVFEQAFTPLEAITPTSARHAGWRWRRCAIPATSARSSAPPTRRGCGAVILVGTCCDPYSVEAVRATMGSIFAVPLVKTGGRGLRRLVGAVAGRGGRDAPRGDDRLPRGRLRRPHLAGDGQRTGRASRTPSPPLAG